MSDNEQVIDRAAEGLVNDVYDTTATVGGAAVSGSPVHIKPRSPPSVRDVHRFSMSCHDPEKIELIDRVLPNLRDLSVSTCHPGLKPGMLYRSARVFSRSMPDIYNVLVKTLNIRTIVDLRDENLTPIKVEDESRLLVSRFYNTHYLIKRKHEILRDAALGSNEGSPQPPSAPVPGSRPASVTGRRNVTSSSTAADDIELPAPGTGASDVTKPDAKWKWPDSIASAVKNYYETGSDLPNTEAELVYRQLRMQRLQELLRDVPDDLALDVVSHAHSLPIFEILTQRSKRHAAVVSVFDTAKAKQRIIQTVSTSPYLPLVVLAKAADKLAGTALAPFYFCKFIVSSRDIETSYYEMLDYCGENFGIALKVIALAPGPVLFHCSLGKDRTGLIALLILAVLGASEQSIIFDYTLTELANEEHQEYNRIFVTKLSGLSPDFATATAQTMRLTMNHLRDRYGGVKGYLDHIGFTKEWRCYIRKRYLTESYLATCGTEDMP